MAITLAKAKVGMADKVTLALIDEFRHNSYLLENMTFDNAVSPSTSGSTLVYGWVKVKVSATAEGRAINSEYNGSEAEKEKCTCELKILGNKYSIDRVIALTGGTAFSDEVAFQESQQVKATTDRFHYLFIKGNATSDSKQFNGLDVYAVNDGRQDGVYIASYDSAVNEDRAEAVCEAIDEGIQKCFRKPDVILTDEKGYLKLLASARKSGYYTRSEDAFGQPVDTYAGIPFIKLEPYGNTAVVDEGAFYFVCLGLDGVHGVSPLQTSAWISTRLPSYDTAGAVKDGDVEMVTAIAVKNARAFYKLTISQTQRTITATETNGEAPSGVTNPTTINKGGYAVLKYTAKSTKTLPSSVSVSGATKVSWDVDATSGIGTLIICNPTANVTFTI